MFNASKEIEKMFVDNLPTESIEQKFQELALSFDSIPSVQQVNLADSLIDARESLLSKDDCCIETGFFALDYALNGGFRAGQLIVVGARPSVGKTALALNMAVHQALIKKNIVFITFEMPAIDLTKRMFVAQAKVSPYKLKKNKVDVNDIKKLDCAELDLSSINFTILDVSSLDLTKLRSKIKILNAQKKIDCLYIDYIGLMTAKGNTIREQFNEITRQVKLMAKDEKIAVVLMAQLNRLLESRDDNRPRLSDLKESGSLEQDADIVLLLHRPKAYASQSDENTAELIIAKHRNGKTGTEKLIFCKDIYRFESST